MYLSTIGEFPPCHHVLRLSLFLGELEDVKANGRRVSRDASQKSVLERQRVGF